MSSAFQVFLQVQVKLLTSTRKLFTSTKKLFTSASKTIYEYKKNFLQVQENFLQVQVKLLKSTGDFLHMFSPLKSSSQSKLFNV